MPQVKFDATREESRIIGLIADRAMDLYKEAKVKRKKTDIMMDIEATHCNGCPLKLDKLLAADNFNFMHDVTGIHRHLDRETGKLTDCFLPRFFDRGTPC